VSEFFSWRSISASKASPPRAVVAGAPAGKAHGGADLRRRQALALGQRATKASLTATPSSAAHQLLARAGRRRLQLQVVGESGGGTPGRSARCGW
jgi:hypothetical protein